MVVQRFQPIMMKIGNKMNVQNKGIFKQMLVVYNGMLCNHKNEVIEEYLLKWKKTFTKISEGKGGYEIIYKMIHL